jgi:hypothetical protein
MTTTPKASERRDGPRIDLRLRVRWSAQTAAGPVSGEAEASDVSPKGLRLESEHNLDNGTDLDLRVDVGGDTDELVARGKVMWCRTHKSPTGRDVFDVGVAFESDWLARDRGPLGQALARIFAMNSYEPARTFERTAVQVSASGSGPLQTGELTMVDLSAGGMQLRASGQIADVVRAGVAVEATLQSGGTSRTLAGRIAWVASSPSGDRFGVEFVAPGADDTAFVEAVRAGQLEPGAVGIVLKT